MKPLSFGSASARGASCNDPVPQRMTRRDWSGYNDAAAWKGPNLRYSLQRGARRSSGALGKGEGVRSILGPAEEYVAPSYASGWIPRALPRVYLVGTMRVVAPGGVDLLPRGRKTRGLL